ncbi:hypothetical protein NHQ30_009838 [Ciborinia camelliae]|nr:hypothetical protein NHQ30_009838 [Ciborinia camelliae]
MDNNNTSSSAPLSALVSTTTMNAFTISPAPATNLPHFESRLEIYIANLSMTITAPPATLHAFHSTSDFPVLQAEIQAKSPTFIHIVKFTATPPAVPGANSDAHYAALVNIEDILRNISQMMAASKQAQSLCVKFLGYQGGFLGCKEDPILRGGGVEGKSKVGSWKKRVGRKQE